MCVWVYVCMYARKCVCGCVYVVCLCVCMYTHTHARERIVLGSDEPSASTPGTRQY